MTSKEVDEICHATRSNVMFSYSKISKIEKEQFPVSRIFSLRISGKRNIRSKEVAEILSKSIAKRNHLCSITVVSHIFFLILGVSITEFALVDFN